jgi:tRNA-specific 2-thiouridylase
MPEAGDVVAVGLSGGVDSCVAAVLLKDRGCRVIGVTMSHWDGGALPVNSEPTRSHACYGPDEAEDIAECAAFCENLGIPYHVVDVREAYKREVLDYYAREYRAGRTPNPCVRCNKEVKFGALLEGLRSLGVEWDYFCTGHYAEVARPEPSLGALYGLSSDAEVSAPAQPAMLRRAKDSAKDQSYFLYRLSSSALERVRFPLAAFTKAEARAFAAERGLAAARRRESQDFAPPALKEALLGESSGAGDFVSLEGALLGKHGGVERYTVGQRRGLGIGAASADARPLYVQSIRREKNQVVLGPEESLYAAGLVAKDAVWAGGFAPRRAFRAEVKIRAGSTPQGALVTPCGQDGLEILFDSPQRAIAPGQSAVAYIHGGVVCGGIISEAIHAKKDLP